MDPELSVVLPIFEEAECLPSLLAELRAELSATGRRYEIVCIDDGSRDATPEVLAKAAAGDPSIRVITFSRNFGKEAALHAGIEAVRGQAAIVLDADGQHPPSTISTMVELWEDGYEVVDARKRSRGEEGPLYRAGAKLFNALVGGRDEARLFGGSDFKLLGAEALTALRSLPERTRFFRGLVHSIGYSLNMHDISIKYRYDGANQTVD